METSWRQKKLDTLIEKYKKGFFTNVYGNDDILVFSNDKMKRGVNISGLEVVVLHPTEYAF